MTAKADRDGALVPVRPPEVVRRRPPPPRRDPLLVSAALGCARLQRSLAAALARSRELTECFFGAALSTPERERIVERLFEARGEYGPQDLQVWEEAWYRRDLPAPGAARALAAGAARVLVGGCGAGRELEVLDRWGYETHGFEPSPALASTARAKVPRARIWMASYEDALTAAGVATLAAAASYSAVIFGWGSIAHVLDDGLRQRVLSQMHRLCPVGPLLLSFPFLHEGEPAPAARWRDRARQLGQLAGSARGVGVDRARREVFLPHAGFLHAFDRAELERAARALGRRVAWGDQVDAYPHCTLIAAAPEDGA